MVLISPEPGADPGPALLLPFHLHSSPAWGRDCREPTSQRRKRRCPGANSSHSAEKCRSHALRSNTECLEKLRTVIDLR